MRTEPDRTLTQKLSSATAAHTAFLFIYLAFFFRCTLRCVSIFSPRSVYFELLRRHFCRNVDWITMAEIQIGFLFSVFLMRSVVCHF